MNLLLRSSLRWLRGHPLQTTLSVIGVALGVAVAVGMDIAISSTERSFKLGADALSGAATHVITGASEGVDEAIYTKLVVETGVLGAAPVVEGHAIADDPRLGAFRLLGIDPYADGSFRGFDRNRLGTPLPLREFLSEPGAVVMSASAAAAAALRVGDSFEASINGYPRTLHVIALADPADASLAAALDRVLLCDVGTAQELLGRVGRLTRIELLSDDEGQLAEVAAALPPGVRLATAPRTSDRLAEMTRAFRFNLRFLSMLALVVGAFLVHNTMAFAVVRRRAVIGKLRAMGLSPGETTRMVVLEGLLLGVVGSVLGVGLGMMLARGLVTLVTQGINDLYFVVAVNSVTPSTWDLVRGLLLGASFATLAAFFPARAAARGAPIEAMRPSDADAKAHSRAPRSALIGGALIGAGGLVFLFGGDGLAWAYAGLGCIVIGFGLMAPLMTVVVARVLRAPMRVLFGVRGLLAVGSAVSGLGRTGVAVGALSVALSMALGVALMVSSFRGAVYEWLDQTLVADVYVTLPGAVARQSGEATLDAAIVSRLSALPEAGGMITNRTVDVDTDLGPLRLVAFGGRPIASIGLPIEEGEPDVLAAADSEDAVLASEPLSRRLGLQVGDTVEIACRGGMRPFVVAGTFRDFAADRGYLAMSRGVYERRFSDRGVTALGLFAVEGVDVEVLASRVTASAGDRQDLVVRSQGALRAASLEVFDRTFRVTSVLRLMAAVVAVAGLIGALMAVQLERRMELAALRARGMTRGELSMMVLLQACLLGLAAGVLSLGLGTVFAWVLTDVINPRSFGWTLPLVVAPGQCLETVIVAVVAAAGAALPAALRLRRLRPDVVMREG